MSTKNGKGFWRRSYCSGKYYMKNPETDHCLQMKIYFLNKFIELLLQPQDMEGAQFKHTI